MNQRQAEDVCKSKVKYTNLKSANRAREVLSVGFKAQMEVYRCGDSKHYHLTHKDPAQRLGHGNRKK
jgi:hypothetical protein